MGALVNLVLRSRKAAKAPGVQANVLAVPANEVHSNFSGGDDIQYPRKEIVFTLNSHFSALTKRLLEQFLQDLTDMLAMILGVSGIDQDVIQVHKHKAIMHVM